LLIHGHPLEWRIEGTVLAPPLLADRASYAIANCSMDSSHIEIISISNKLM
jgi:hypothetical protein